MGRECTSSEQLHRRPDVGKGRSVREPPGSRTAPDTSFETRSLPRVNTEPYSVVVPTRAESADLQRIERNLVPASSDAELIVVSNRRWPPTDTKPPSLAYNGLRHLTCCGGGVSRARNIGLAAATHDIIVFLDDDVIATKGQIHRLAGVLADASLGVATARVLANATTSETLPSTSCSARRPSRSPSTLTRFRQRFDLASRPRAQKRSTFAFR